MPRSARKLFGLPSSSGRLPDLTLSALLARLGVSSRGLLGGFDPGLSKLWYSLDLVGPQYEVPGGALDLVAQGWLDGLGRVGLEVQAGEGGGFAFGIDVQGRQLETIPGLGFLAEVAEIIELENAVFTVSTLAVDRLSFSTLPPGVRPRGALRPVSLPGTDPTIQQGVYLYADVDLGKGGSKTAFGRVLKDLHDVLHIGDVTVFGAVSWEPDDSEGIESQVPSGLVGPDDSQGSSQPESGPISSASAAGASAGTSRTNLEGKLSLYGGVELDGLPASMSLQGMVFVEQSGTKMSGGVAGSLTVPIGGDEQSFEVDGILQEGGEGGLPLLTLSGEHTGKWNDVLGTGIDVDDAWIALTLTDEFPFVVGGGIGTTIVAGGVEGSMAVYLGMMAGQSGGPFDDVQVLLAGAVSDIDLRRVCEGIAGSSIDGDLGRILERIGIRGVGSFRLGKADGSLLRDLKAGTLSDELVAAFAKGGVRLSDGSLVQAGGKRRWLIADLAQQSFYEVRREGEVLKASSDAQFYLAPQKISIGTLEGQITYPAGFAIKGTLDLLVVSIPVDLDLRLGRGIDQTFGVGEEIHLWGTDIAIRGPESPIEATIRTFGDETGARLQGTFDFFGALVEELTMDITKDGVHIEVEQELGLGIVLTFGDFFYTLDLTVDRADDLTRVIGGGTMGIEGALSLDLGSLGGLSLDVFDMEVGLELKGGMRKPERGLGLAFEVDARFDIELFDLGSWHWTQEVPLVRKRWERQVASEVMGELVPRVLDALKDGPWRWLKMVADGAIEIGGKVLKVGEEAFTILRDELGVGADAVLGLLKKAGVWSADLLEDVFLDLHRVFDLDPEAIAKALLDDFDRSYDTVMRVLKAGFGFPRQQAAQLLKDMDRDVGRWADDLKRVYDLEATEVARALESIGYDGKQLVNAFENGLDYGLDDTMKALRSARLTMHVDDWLPGIIKYFDDYDDDQILSRLLDLYGDARYVFDKAKDVFDYSSHQMIHLLRQVGPKTFFRYADDLKEALDQSSATFAREAVEVEVDVREVWKVVDDAFDKSDREVMEIFADHIHPELWVKEIKDWKSWSSNELASELRKADKSAKYVTHLLKHVLDKGTGSIEDILDDVGYDADEVGKALGKAVDFGEDLVDDVISVF